MLCSIYGCFRLSRHWFYALFRVRVGMDYIDVVFLSSVEKGNLGVPQLPGQGCSFHSFRTNTYKLNFMETPSGIKVS